MRFDVGSMAGNPKWHLRRTLLAIALGAALLLHMADMTFAAPPSPANEADGSNWQNYGRTYSDDHFSPLTQINDKNVEHLGLAWAQDLNTFNSFTAPLEVDGVLYFALGHSVIHAMDARTGKLLWKYDPEVWKRKSMTLRIGWGTRGIAFDHGKVFTATHDGRLIAVDAKTGKLLWSTMTVDPNGGAYISGPPWVFKNKVVIGFGGGDFGGRVRGYVTAYEQDTGKQAWRFFTVPGDPKKGFEDSAQEMAAKTWTGEWWQWGGGGTVWQAMNYDPKYNRLYIGTGNGFPWNQKIRSPGGGDNLFLASIVALDADTGKYVWHYQMSPADGWDYDSAADIELADLTIDGRVHSVLIQAPKNGFFYVIDRENGKLLSADKFAPVNWADHIDIQTGRPVENPLAHYPGGKPFEMYPSAFGAHGDPTMSFNPRTRLAYIPTMDQHFVYVDPPNIATWKMMEGMHVNTGLGPQPPTIHLPEPTSSLVAYDPVKQKIVWQIAQNPRMNGGTITTAGNLVFQGLSTGDFLAYAADSGKLLWSFPAQNGILGNAVTYSIDGKQYLTVLTGWRSQHPGKPDWDYRQQKRRVLTFTLDGRVKLPPAEFVDRPIVDDPAIPIDPAKSALGAQIFNTTCFNCHGPAVHSGGAAPDLRKSSIPLDADTFKSVVRDGALAPAGMPSFDEFTEQELEGLRMYIRQRCRDDLAGKAADTTRPY
jgi:quinohemoprotein ethanol dehydrogenase